MSGGRNRQTRMTAAAKAALAKRPPATLSRTGRKQAATKSFDGVGNMKAQRLLCRGVDIEEHRSSPMAFPNADRVLQNLRISLPLTGVRDARGCAARGKICLALRFRQYCGLLSTTLPQASVP
jgi:hypothetical protein